MSKVLVTGGAGFVGSHLVDRLIKDGHEVTIVDNLSTGQMKNINWESASFINLDVSKNKFVKTLERHSFDFIFHLAAQINLRESIRKPTEDAKTNIIGSLNVIELAKKLNSKIIFASTGGAIYSPDEPLPWDELSETEPQSPYGLAKLTVEKYLQVCNLDYCVFRLANVYGPRQNSKGEAGVISIFINNIINNKSLKIFGNGQQTRDFVYVSDVVDALVRGIKLTGIFNVSTGTESSVYEIADLVRERMWNNAQLEFEPEIKGELKRSCLENSRLKDEGWEPKIPLDDGIALTVNYFAK